MKATVRRFLATSAVLLALGACSREQQAQADAAAGGSRAHGADVDAGLTSRSASADAGGARGSSESGGASGAPQAFHACPVDGNPCKVMPFGDSITNGYDTPGGYRVELFRLLHAAGKTITFVGSGSNGPDMVDGTTFPANHEGHNGWTIAPTPKLNGISTLVASVMPQFTPQIVLLMIGTNDATVDYEMDTAPDRLGQLIDSIYAQLPDVVIFVAQPIPARGDGKLGDDTELNARVQTFNKAIPAVVEARVQAGKHIFVVDMYTPFASDQRPLFLDQYHPNATGYDVMGSTWYAAIESLL